MFLQNKYTDCYFRIINRAKNRLLFEYTEKHHIFPKSLGGANNTDNLVQLTAREHLICHRLLIKMVEGNAYYKMVNALWAMSKLKNRYHQRIAITSRFYEKIKKDRSAVLSEIYSGDKNPFYGKRHSESSKEKMKGRIVSDSTRAAISDRQRERFKSMSGTFLGKKHSDESKEKIRLSKLGKKDSEELKLKKSLAAKNRPPVSEETKQKLRLVNKGKPGLCGESNGFYGKSHSEEHREKKRQEKLNSPRLSCPHCSKVVDNMNYARWHGDKCKQRK